MKVIYEQGNDVLRGRLQIGNSLITTIGKDRTEINKNIQHLAKDLFDHGEIDRQSYETFKKEAVN